MSRYHAEDLNYQEIKLFGKPALFTECRIDRTTIPDDVYRYEIRHGDEDWGEAVSLARRIVVNYYGTVLTREPIQLPVSGQTDLSAGDIAYRNKGCRTLAEFQQTYPVSEKDTVDFYSVNNTALHRFYFSQDEEQDQAAGCIGHLRGDFGSGQQFYTTWWPHQGDVLNTPEFKADIDRTVDWLRGQPDSPLRDLAAMERCCDRYQRTCAIHGAILPSCGFMVETKRYVYMLRCTPVKGDYHFYMYCYQREKFEQASKQQEKYLRPQAKKRTEPER